MYLPPGKLPVEILERLIRAYTRSKPGRGYRQKEPDLKSGRDGIGMIDGDSPSIVENTPPDFLCRGCRKIRNPAKSSVGHEGFGYYASDVPSPAA